MRSLFLAFCCVSVTASSEYYGSCPSGEGAGCEAEQSDTFAPRPGASLTEYLNPLIFGNETFVQQIGETLHHQKLMVIHDAFIPEFAEYVWRDLDAVEKWEYHDDYTEPGYICRKHNVYEMANYTKVMNETFAMFDHPTTREFVAHITGRDVSGPLSGSSSNYMAGDYCMPHSDDGHGRTVSFVWHLSKNWKPEWGGALYWNAEQSGNAYIPASFNTLHLFSVNRKSDHFVTPVTEDAKEKRLAFNGWFNHGDVAELHVEPKDLVKKYGTFEERLTLSTEQIESVLQIDANDVNEEFHNWQEELYSEVMDHGETSVINLKDPVQSAMPIDQIS